MKSNFFTNTNIYEYLFFHKWLERRIVTWNVFVTLLPQHISPTKLCTNRKLGWSSFETFFNIKAFVLEAIWQISRQVEHSGLNWICPLERVPCCSNGDSCRQPLRNAKGFAHYNRREICIMDTYARAERTPRPFQGSPRNYFSQLLTSWLSVAPTSECLVASYGYYTNPRD